MSKILRQTIVPIAAVIGAQLPGLFFQPQPGQSSSCLQWANDAIDAAREALPESASLRTAEDGYYDVRQHKDVDLPRSSATPASHADATDPATLGTQASAAVDGVGAALPDGLTEEQYQQQRLASASDRSMVLGGY